MGARRILRERLLCQALLRQTLLGCLLLPACGREGDNGAGRPGQPVARGQAVAQSPADPGLRSVQWRLRTDRARTQPDGAGLLLHTDAGYEVHLHQLLLTTWRLGLSPCPKPVGWSLIPEAYANHVEPPDPTSLLPHLTEDLLAPDDRVLGPRTLPPGRYCQGFWLASAPPPAQAGDAPRVSLRLEASWQQPGPPGQAPRQGQVLLETWMPDAKLGAVPGLAEASGARQIVVTRRLGDLLDGVDLATAPTPALAWQVLHKLVNGADWRVH